MKKLLLVCFVCLIGLTSLTGCRKDEADKNIICEAEEAYNKGNGHSFVLDSDGKTIKSATYYEGINKDFLEKYYGEFSLDDSYNSTKISLEKHFDNFMLGNEDIPWLRGGISETPSKYEVELKIIIDFTDENFKANEATLNYLKQFGLDVFYNEDEKVFEFDKDVYDKTFGQSFVKPVCSEKKNK